MYRREGIFWCPRCFARREFVPTPWAADGDMYPPMECVECDYVFDKVVQEDREGGAVHAVPAVSHAVRDKAREELRQSFAMSVARGGYKLRPADLAILTKDKDG